MKKIVAILLVLLLSFNFVGYRLYFYLLQKKADITLVASLDAAQYHEADLITLRVPLNMPYQTYHTEAERINGEINVDGTIYKYVKRKIEAGTLVLWCLPDKQKMQLEDAQHQAFKITNDVPATDKSDAGKGNTFKNPFSDYDQQVTNWSIGATQPAHLQHFLQQQNVSISFYFSIPEQPPEVITA